MEDDGLTGGAIGGLLFERHGFFRPSTDAYYISFIFAVQWIISFILSSFAEFPYNHVNKISRLDILGNIVSSIPFLVVFYWCITS